MNKKILYFGLILLVIGNAWCYIENDRLLKPLTNIFIIGLLAINFFRKDDK